MRAVLAVARWRLSTSAVSLRLVPPAMALVAVLLMVFTMRGQPAGSVVAAQAIVAFVLAVWIGLAHGSALAPGHRAVTQATVGFSRAFAGEVLAGTVLVAAFAVVLVAWPAAIDVTAPAPRPNPAVLAGSYLVVVAAGLSGLGCALVIDALGVRAPVRFLTAVAVVSLGLARPALADAGGAVRAVTAVATPAVMDAARAADQGDTAGLTTGAVTCVVWAVCVAAVARVLRARRAPLD